MSADFLTTLAARTLGLTPVIQPSHCVGRLCRLEASGVADGRWQKGRYF